MENCCGACRHFHQHYVMDSQSCMKVCCGHCSYPRLKSRKPDTPACGNFAPGERELPDVLAKQFEIDPETVTMETNLIDDIGADSLDVVELIMSLEDSYGISISDEEAAELYTVRRIVEYLEKLQ